MLVRTGIASTLDSSVPLFPREFLPASVVYDGASLRVGDMLLFGDVSEPSRPANEPMAAMGARVPQR